eukprot:200638-Prymnesium_polylepis.2
MDPVVIRKSIPARARRSGPPLRRAAALRRRLASADRTRRGHRPCVSRDLRRSLGLRLPASRFRLLARPSPRLCRVHCSLINRTALCENVRRL